MLFGVHIYIKKSLFHELILTIKKSYITLQFFSVY